ncbi:MAG: hypothetical protein KKG93_13695, partial [Bacteroidetes bacterium]|nr:hypothetical protein [Bacteroidota bacterium]
MRNKTILFTILVFAVLLKVNAQSLTTCDYLIVAPSSFLASTTWDDDLISLQQSRGFTPYIYSVSDGTSASSIKSQIATAYYVGTVLKHVLIVGNGSSLEESDTATQSVEAPNIYIQQGTIIETTSFADGNYIPFWSVTSNNIWGTNGTSEVASDDPYIDGLTSRGDVFIGRIPAESINEISNYVDKLIAYYTNMSTYSDHNLKELYFGRDVTDTNNHCLGSSVVALRDSLITNHIPSHITTTILNVSDYIGTDAFAYSSTRASLFESALNSGVSLISMLSTSGGPVDFGGFYSNSDNANFNFTNISKQPFLLALNCMQGYVNDLRWSNYNQSTMRQLMMYEAGGIIGSIAPTEGSVQRINGKLLNLAHDKIYNDEIKHVGELNVILKAEIMQNYPDHEFYANGLTLFADPSMLLSVFRNKSGTISSSTTWEGNILVDSDVTVNSGVTLTIKAGASITFQNGARLKVDGILNVNGTSSNKVTFDFESPTYPNGIWFWLGGTGIINNAIIKNAY